MRITLAYPWQGHRPDQTLDVDDHVGRDLVRSGRARIADEPEPAPRRTSRRRTDKTTRATTPRASTVARPDTESEEA